MVLYAFLRGARVIHLRGEMARDFWRWTWREYRKPEYWGYWALMVFGISAVLTLGLLASLGWKP